MGTLLRSRGCENKLHGLSTAGMHLTQVPGGFIRPNLLPYHCEGCLAWGRPNSFSFFAFIPFPSTTTTCSTPFAETVSGVQLMTIDPRSVVDPSLLWVLSSAYTLRTEFSQFRRTAEGIVGDNEREYR